MKDSPPTTVAAERNGLRRQLAQLRAEREVLLRSLEFHERDRQLLAFEIHDGLVQDISAAAMFLEVAQRQAEFSSPKGRESWEKAVRLLRDAVAESRRLIQGLIPIVLDGQGLVASLRRMISRFHADAGLVVGLTAEGEFPRLTPAAELVVLRIMQEALTNVWRHSRTTEAAVRLRRRDDRLILEVEDRGVGFVAAEVEKTRYGLTGIRERARLFGGRAIISSTPGVGTRVAAYLPLGPASLPPEFHEAPGSSSNRPARRRRV